MADNEAGDQQGTAMPAQGGDSEPPGTVRITSVVPPESRATNERLIREQVRWRLAYVMAGTFLLTVAAAFVGSVWGNHWSNVSAWLQVVLPAETAILGSAIGFYFGTQRGSDGRSE